MIADRAWRILVVDDEVEQLRTLQLGLRSRGYEAVTAASAEEALERLRSEEGGFQLVLTDYSMPGMNGMEFLEQIRLWKRNLPVILMTAYGEKEVLVRALQNDCSGFIEKPFTVETLIREIERVREMAGQDAGSDDLSEALPFLLHQINNPLMVIMASAQVGMLAAGTPEKLKGKLRRILEAAESIKRLNRTVLDLSRGMEAAFHPVDLSEVVGDCLEGYRDLAQLKSVTIESSLCRECMIQGNRFGLEQVFRNLFTNAIEAMENSEEKTLHVQVRLLEDRTPQVMIRDTGSGFSEQSLSGIFQTYFTTKPNGNGLGLAVVNKIMKKHNGSIELQGERGQGACFYLSFPYVN